MKKLVPNTINKLISIRKRIKLNWDQGYKKARVFSNLEAEI